MCVCDKVQYILCVHLYVYYLSLPPLDIVEHLAAQEPDISLRSCLSKTGDHSQVPASQM